jgi:hypothetical protein
MNDTRLAREMLAAAERYGDPAVLEWVRWLTHQEQPKKPTSAKKRTKNPGKKRP